MAIWQITLFAGASGNDIIDGGAGIDAAAFSETKTSCLITQTHTGYTVSGGTNGTDSLTNIERLQFSDVHLALDVNGNAGITAKILGSVFGATSLSNQSYVGIGLQYLDNGMSNQDLMLLALNARLGAGFSDAVEVDLLYQNLTGVLPSIAERNYWVGTITSGQFTQTSLAVMASELGLNTVNIDLVGLAQTGIEYI